MKRTGFPIARLFRAIGDELRTREMVRALQRLDDRALADIGISRGEIDDRVRGHSRRRH